MEIIVGKNAGFCFGVDNAVKKTKLELNNNKKAYCLGELVHNIQVIEELNKKGLETIHDIKDVPQNSTVIIRAHGVGPKIYEKANERNIKLIDLTCPKVLKIHSIVSEYAKNGYYIILAGGEEHPETIGSKGFAGENSVVIEDESELKEIINKIKNDNIQNILLVSQTTFLVKKFNSIEERLKNAINEINSENERTINLEIKNTICNATNNNQIETKEISKKVDCMIIIGRKKEL